MMQRTQRGATLFGWLGLLIMAGLIGLAGLRLVPVYLEYMKVVSVLEGVKEELDGRDPSPSKIKNALANRFNVENVQVLKFDQIDISREAAGYAVSAEYEHEAPYIANVSFLVSFKKSVTVRR